MLPFRAIIIIFGRQTCLQNIGAKSQLAQLLADAQFVMQVPSALIDRSLPLSFGWHDVGRGWNFYSQCPTVTPCTDHARKIGDDRKMPMVLETKEEYRMTNGAKPMVSAPVSRTLGLPSAPPPNIFPPKGKTMLPIHQCKKVLHDEFFFSKKMCQLPFRTNVA